MRGQASVIAMIVVFFLLLLTISLTLYVTASYLSLQKEYLTISQIKANQAKENLLISYSDGSLSIYNAGTVVTKIVAILLINPTNVTIQPENVSISPNQNIIIHVGHAQSYVVVTSYGNSYYVKLN
ncbi:hypothetical protein BFU36_08835 [Sulfolobus sp. A20]|uniref:hypothetical protein n=1 Tax=Saccharolobus sp. A20 TaxID=1891280 RepID=UPI000845D09F|nr:hypothetical protein [Sulfolobus sp. A20]TRM79623.1 hypothetical protein DJ528_00020 [Sulfolobus sp. B5]TRM79991.1 hypothetical protein DJ531_12895 [Sulfolobus sp. A20-N-F6]TRM89372.1 hypothetical protein DJ529_02565 [Sulfolobus sp. C3]TRN01148.1 hypothetical protein DJ530_06420 [Sulfolobus sp. E1]TRN04670.1 hypothetical protein DJ527_00155 [Sulfolobus sp. F1]